MSITPDSERARQAATARARRLSRGPDPEAFRLLVDAVQDYAIFMLDVGGHVDSWNAGAERIKGYSPEEIIGQHFSVFYPAEDLAWDKPARELEIARAEGRLEDEGWRIRKDGSRFWANVVITTLYDDDGVVRGFAKVTRDLTERRKSEEARATFIANAAHELRTPLAVIVGLVSYLKQTEALDPVEFAEQVEVLARQGDRMHHLVNNLLDLTLLQDGRVEMPSEPVDVAEVAERVLRTLPPPTDKRVSTDFDGTMVLAEDKRLEQVLTNLITNAYRHGGETIVLSARANGDLVEIVVADDGPGVEAELLPHLFEPFRRGSTTGAVQGSGLGLAIVKGLVEAYDGKISLDPDASGARFIITLKRA
jgi:PAS domain S-box-containing protein